MAHPLLQRCCVIAAFQPASKEKLKQAVDACSADCSAGQHGPISDWDVSRVTKMDYIFYKATSFKGDISKWKVASVTDMNTMFAQALRFNSDISKWDVSSVTDMQFMFYDARSFNGDISNWDVSRVKRMDGMFTNAVSFKQTLCGAWEVSTASGKASMFSGSRGKLCSGALVRGESDAYAQR